MDSISTGAAEVTDLSHPLTSGLPAAEPHGAPQFGSSPHTLSGTEFTIGRLTMSAHTGTHVDAPSHILPEGKTLTDFTIDRFFGLAVVADLSAHSIVTANILRNLPTPLGRGEALFVSFGRAQLYGTDEYKSDHPYFADDAAEWLIERGAPFLGLDTPTPDMPSSARGLRFDFPVHRTLLGGDCLIIENLGAGVADLVGKRVQFCALPLPLAGLDGSPVRVVAWTTSE